MLVDLLQTCKSKRSEGVAYNLRKFFTVQLYFRGQYPVYLFTNFVFFDNSLDFFSGLGVTFLFLDKTCDSSLQHHKSHCRLALVDLGSG